MYKRFTCTKYIALFNIVCSLCLDNISYMYIYIKCIFCVYLPSAFFFCQNTVQTTTNLGDLSLLHIVSFHLYHITESAILHFTCKFCKQKEITHKQIHVLETYTVHT